nr:uncharacterized protein LOC116769644 isoform X3 [Danaus plexippus plexippus]XP_032516680.1 uncharacterized protein LOC116769644 isoform X3 [Danaus plexippus plexippus]
MQYRQYMIRDEVLMNLDTLKDYSCYDYGKKELLENLPALFTLMKHILVEYDDSQLNIVITNILNNIVVKKIIQQDDEKKKAIVLTDTSTEPVEMKNEIIQIPPRKILIKSDKAKSSLGISPNKHKNKRKISGWEPTRSLNKSRKFTRETKNTVIIVPLEK